MIFSKKCNYILKTFNFYFFTWCQLRCHIFGAGDGENAADEDLRLSVQLGAPLLKPFDGSLISLKYQSSLKKQIFKLRMNEHCFALLLYSTCTFYICKAKALALYKMLDQDAFSCTV